MWSMLLSILICASLLSGILMLSACRLSACADARAPRALDEPQREGATGLVC